MTNATGRFGNTSAAVAQTTIWHGAKGRDAIQVGEHVWSVQVVMPYGSDDMIEVIEHSVRFTRRERAERLAAEVRAHQGPLNYSEWCWQSSKCSAYSFMHNRPTAVPTVKRGL